MIDYCCERMSFFINERRVLISYIPRFREYGIKTTSGGIQLIDFCPWCGSKLPNPSRDQWFNTLEQMGIEAELFSEKGDVPDEFLTDEWWKKRGL